MKGILCLQPSQAALYRRYFPDTPVVAAPPGLMKIHPPTADDHFKRRQISYVGSLQMKKGIEVLLSAFESLPRDRFRLALIGGRSSDEIEPVEQAIRQRQLTDHVSVTGWLPFEEVVRHLKMSSAGVLPLRDTFYNRYLTAPNKLFDYLSCGLPVIASDVPAIRDFDRGEAGGINWVRPDDALTLAAGIREVFVSRERYEQMRRQAQRLAEEHVWQRRAREMLTVIDDLCQSGR